MLSFVYNILTHLLKPTGGYDNRVAENVGYHKELVELAESLSLQHASFNTVVTALNVPDNVEVLFLLSVPNSLKDMLLQSARLLVYTPSNEHFGIVPLEAMLKGVPVLAANTGGPTETVVEGLTGWLRDPDDVQQWTDVMGRVLSGMSAAELAAMSKAGEERVRSHFADVQMAQRLDAIFTELEGVQRQSSSLILLVPSLIIAILAAVALGLWFRSSALPSEPSGGR